MLGVIKGRPYSKAGLSSDDLNAMTSYSNYMKSWIREIHETNIYDFGLSFYMVIGNIFPLKHRHMRRMGNKAITKKKKKMKFQTHFSHCTFRTILDCLRFPRNIGSSS